MLTLQPMTGVQCPIRHLSHHPNSAHQGNRAQCTLKFKWHCLHFLWRVIDHNVKAGINVKGISPFTAVTKGPFSIIFELLGGPFDNNKHCSMNTWRARERSHSSAESRILSVWNRPRQCHRAAMQTQHARCDSSESDQWLWLFVPAKRPGTLLRGAFITHCNVWLMKSEKWSPLISIRWPPADCSDWSRLLLGSARSQWAPREIKWRDLSSEIWRPVHTQPL